MVKTNSKHTKRMRGPRTKPRGSKSLFRCGDDGFGMGREVWLGCLFAHVGDAIYIHDLEGRIVDVNPAATETFGYSRAELLALHPWDIVTNASRQEMLALWQEVECGWRVTVERSYRRKDGGQVLGEVRLTRARAAEGDVIIALCRDITARRQTEEALHASEQLARGQVEALRHGLDAVAREAAPDRFLDEVLRTMSRMLRAHTTSLWLQDEQSPAPRFVSVAIGGTPRLLSTAETCAGTNGQSDHPLAADVLRSQSAVFCEDIEGDPRFEQNRERWLAEGIRSVLAVPLVAGRKVRGLVSLSSKRRDGYRPDEIELAQALAHQAALAVQLARFAAAGRQAAVLEERNRVARDIHDTLAQGFTGTIVQLEAAQAALANRHTREAGRHIHQACELARESLREARRSVLALRSPALIAGDLPGALGDLFQLMTHETGLQIEFTCAGEPRRLPPDWQEHLLHIGREALTNTLRHARARQFAARLSVNANEVCFELSDNGNGFDPSRLNGGFGLTGMRERAARMGGHLSVTSAMGAGTGIRLTVPVAAR